MAKIVGVFNMSHSPFCYMAPERWNEIRANRSHRADVPMDSLEENKKKAERIRNGFATLRQKLADVRPDVIVICGDDQLECFDFTNFPAFSIYVGEAFDGESSAADMRYGSSGSGGREAGAKASLKGHPDLAVALLTGVMRHGFDPAFSMEMTKPDEGFGHAIMRPAESLTDMNVAIIPVLVNCYYAPQPTGQRCYEFGKAIRDVVESYPGNQRVAIVGSGGLWHTPWAKNAYIDEDFDRLMLRDLEAGDAIAMAAHFDSYRVPDGDTSQFVGERGKGITGMPGPGGPQGGTREISNWIIAAGAAEGHKSTVIDYVPVYASPIGVGFSYCQID